MTQDRNKLVNSATYIMLILPAAVVLSPPLSNLLELILCILFLSSYELRTRFIESFKQPIVKFGFLFVIVIILSSLWSPASWEIKKEAIVSWRKIFLLPMIVSLINTNYLKDRFIITFIVFSSIVAFVSWFLNITDISFSKSPNAILRNHVTQTMVFFISSYFAAGILIFNKELLFKTKVLLCFCLIPLLSNSFLISTGRSGYILGVVLLLSLGFFSKNKKVILAIPVLLIIMLSVLYISPTTNSQIKKAIDNITNVENAEEYSSAGIRMVFWKNTLEMITPPTFLGHGLKSFESEYRKQVDETESWKNIITGDPHNQYLLILVEQGLIGILVFFAFIISFFFQKPDSFYKTIGLAILCGWLVTSLFNGHFSSSVEGRLVLLLCAAMLSAPVFKERHLKENKNETI